MEKLDQFFNDKMGQRDIPFNEEHWKLAEQLLDEKKKKRRFAFLLWWGSGVFTAVGVAFAIWLWPSTSKVTIDQFLIPLNGGIKSSIQNPIIAKNEETQTKTLTLELNQVDTNTSSKSTFEAPTKQGTTKNRINYITPSNEKENKSLNTNTSETNKITSAQDQIESKQNEQYQKPIDNNELNETNAESTISALALLTTKFGYLNYPLRTLENNIFEEEENANEPKIKVAVKHWSWGLSANAMLYPYRTDANETLIGWNAGAFVSYNWNTSWGIQSGINYRLRTGQFGFAKDSNIASFRFGREDQRFLLLPNQLHYLELPLMVQYTNRRHQFGLGARLQYLLGVRGSLRNTFDADSEPNLFNTNEVDQGWIVKDGFKEWPIDLTLSYFYEITNRWQVGAEASYTIGGILDNGYERPFPIIYQESLPISLNVGVRFIID